VAERADVEALLALDLKEELGTEGKKLALVGLAEAVERSASTGDHLFTSLVIILYSKLSTFRRLSGPPSVSPH
jgi:hypothetical protein